MISLRLSKHLKFCLAAATLIMSGSAVGQAGQLLTLSCKFETGYEDVFEFRGSNDIYSWVDDFDYLNVCTEVWTDKQLLLECDETPVSKDSKGFWQALTINRYTLTAKLDWKNRNNGASTFYAGSCEKTKRQI